MRQTNRYLATKIGLIGILIAVLIFLFHPSIGHLSLIINGEPVADPLMRLAALPTLLIVLIITAFLYLLLFFGAGVLIFLSMVMISFFGILLLAPYFWPILVIIFLVIALMSMGGHSNQH